jgi:hypothetical protein
VVSFTVAEVRAFSAHSTREQQARMAQGIQRFSSFRCPRFFS